jgi:hypothetical protein
VLGKQQGERMMKKVFASVFVGLLILMSFSFSLPQTKALNYTLLVSDPTENELNTSFNVNEIYIGNDGSSLYFQIYFTAAPLSSVRTSIYIEMDTDRNSNTGFTFYPMDIGVEYSLGFTVYENAINNIVLTNWLSRQDVATTASATLSGNVVSAQVLLSDIGSPNSLDIFVRTNSMLYDYYSGGSVIPVEVDSNFRTITVDGSISDWTGISPTASDPVDMPESMSNVDITSFYIAHDQNNLYFRYNFAENWIGTTYSISIGDRTEIYFSTGYQLFFQYGLPILATQGQAVQNSDIHGSARQNVVELSVARVDIGNPIYLNLTASALGQRIDDAPDSGHATYNIDASSNPTQTYPFTFKQVGLPLGTHWSLTIEGQTKSTNGNEILVFLAEGTYQYSVNTESSNYVAFPNPGNINVLKIEEAWQAGMLDRTCIIFLPISTAFDEAFWASWNPVLDSYNIINPSTQWETKGNCYGISSTSILYFEHYTSKLTSSPYYPSQDPAALSTSNLDLGTGSNLVSSFNNASLAVFMHQYYDGKATLHDIYEKPLINMHDQFLLLNESLSGGKPVNLGLFHKGSLADHHSVVAFGVGKLENGSYAIAVYDSNFPETTQVAIYDENAGFNYAYYVDTAFYSWDGFRTDFPTPIEMSWFNPWWNPLTWNRQDIIDSVKGYDIIVTNKQASGNKVVSDGKTDYFTESGNSQSFVCGIPGTSGISEGNVFVYAVPTGTSYEFVDPGASQSQVFIGRFKNQSGVIVEYGYSLNLTAAQGVLNCTVAPTGDGLLVTSLSGAFEVNTIIYSSTGSDLFVSPIRNVEIAAGQEVVLSVNDWSTLNNTGIQAKITKSTPSPSPTFSEPFSGPFNIVTGSIIATGIAVAIIAVVIALIFSRKKKKARNAQMYAQPPPPPA